MSAAVMEDGNVHITSIKIKKDEHLIIQNNNSVGVKHAAPVSNGAHINNGGSGTSGSTEAKSSSDIAAGDDSHVKPTSASSSASKPATEVPTNRGIDDLLPATELWTTKGDEPVKLRVAEMGLGSEKPITVPTLIQSTVKRLPNSKALAVKRNGKWLFWSYQEYYQDVRRAAKAFIKLGLEPHKAVGIIGFNSPEWLLSDLGCIFAGGFATGIYTTNSPEACQFVAASCQANVIVVENNQQLEKILQVKDQLPDLKAIVQYMGDVANRQPFIYSWSEFMALADQVEDSALEERMKLLAPNKCCTLIYTSGTTGNPKGVMLSHDNITWTAHTVYSKTNAAIRLHFGEFRQVSYLPLSHIAAQMLDMYGTICFGGTLFFAQPDALKGTLGDTLKEVQPHVIEAKPFGWTLANKLVFRKVRAGTGLVQCRFMLSGAAPITKETLEFFLSLDVPICEVYGMSECTGPHTLGYPDSFRVTSVGRELPGMTTKLVDKDEDGNGEIVMFGRHVFMGYLNEEEKTRETLDSEGGLHSGDIGKKDKDGFYYITGRIKELIITAGGENVAPVPIEEALKEELPVVSQCMLIGDKKKFLAILITLRTEVDPDTLEPRNTLTPAALDWCQSVGSSAKTVSEILEPGDKAVLGAIQAGIDRVNKRAESRAKNIQKWSVLPKDFSIPGGELGPTMKMRRPIITKMYTKTIAALYDEAPAQTS
ncbi:hypothetical protein BaRGS_00036809 [Batillaria attramentaria]|uniref:long-chain-fatty-acid--CoA ligase n=1 Tax=Batillaria attramentaria TaxID=370345 RepID=A0ABD0JB53_9CAEN